MREKTVQYFTKEYLIQCKKLHPDQIIEFLENYKLLTAENSEQSQFISLKVEPSLLRAFKNKAKLEKIPYQTQIKNLMKTWLIDS